MKKIQNAVLLLCIICFAASCKKDSKKDDLGSNLPSGLSRILTSDILNKLKTDGTVINEGLTPPTISGIYLLSPTLCTYDNSSDDLAGQTIDDYHFEFSNQNNSALTISAQYKDISSGDDVGSDNSATFISGSGNLFTIYAQTTGTEDGISNTQLQIISGEISSGTVKNLQLSIYLKSKGSDPDGDLAPVGTTRIFKDGDGTSQSQTTFAVNPARQLNKLNNGAPQSLKALLSTIKKQ